MNAEKLLERYYREYTLEGGLNFKGRQTPKLLARIFPEAARKPLLEAYTLLRFIDDIVDSQRPRQKRQLFLEAAKQCYVENCGFKPIRRLRKLARNRRLQEEKFLEMLEAMKLEIEKEGSFYSQGELYHLYQGVQVAPQWIMLDIAGVEIPEEFHAPVGITAMMVKELRGKELLEDLFGLNRFYFSVEELQRARLTPSEARERFLTAEFDRKTEELYRNRIYAAYLTVEKVPTEALKETPQKIVVFGAVYLKIIGYWAEKLRRNNYRPYNKRLEPLKDSPTKVHYILWYLKARRLVWRKDYGGLLDYALSGLEKGF